MSATGRPSDLHPRSVAHALQLPVRNGHVDWNDLLNAACLSYWLNRPEQNPRTLAEYRRRQKRRKTPVEVWIRRGAA